MISAKLFWSRGYESTSTGSTSYREVLFLLRVAASLVFLGNKRKNYSKQMLFDKCLDREDLCRVWNISFPKRSSIEIYDYWYLKIDISNTVQQLDYK